MVVFLMFDEEKTLCMRFFCLIILVRVGYVNYSLNFQGRSAIIAYPPSSSERSGEGEGGYAIR